MPDPEKPIPPELLLQQRLDELEKTNLLSIKRVIDADQALPPLDPKTEELLETMMTARDAAVKGSQITSWVTALIKGRVPAESILKAWDEVDEQNRKDKEDDFTII